MSTNKSDAAHPATQCELRQWGAILTVLYLLLVLPVVWLEKGQSDDAGDQKNYHEPFILQLAKDWPQVDLINTHGLAMTPGYHLGLAALNHYAGVGVIGLRYATAIMGLPLLWFVFGVCARWTQASMAFCLTMPLLLSSFVLGSSMWLRPDNVALCAVVLALGITILQPIRPNVILMISAVIVGGVAVRQVNIWLLAPLGLVVLLALLPQQNDKKSGGGAAANSAAIRLILTGIVAAAGPLLLLGYFYRLWDGLLPPAVAANHPVGNGFKILPVIFALVGFFGLFFVPMIWRRSLAQLRRDPWVIGAFVFGLLIAIVPPTGDPAGPSGFLLQLQRTPVWGGRVLLLIPFSALGGVVLTVLVQAAIQHGRGRPALLLLFSFVIWALTMTANVYVFRRYCEPFILVCLAWWVGLALPDGRKNPRFWLSWGLLMLVQTLGAGAKIYYPVWKAF